MLQEIPHGKREKFMAAVQRYSKQELGFHYEKNNTHPFGNLIFYRKDQQEELFTNTAIKKLQAKYKDNQVNITLLKDKQTGEQKLLVDVHLESELSDKAVRVKPAKLLREIEEIRKAHPKMKILVEGDFNKDNSMKDQLDKQLIEGNNPAFDYQHSLLN